MEVPVNCACGSNLAYRDCCEPCHRKITAATTAEALMRSRYTAFVLQNAEYLLDTLHPNKRDANSKKSYLKSVQNTKWIKLEILFSNFDMVEFKAYYLNKRFEIEVLHEKSNFKFENGFWYYVDGEFY